MKSAILCCVIALIALPILCLTDGSVSLSLFFQKDTQCKGDPFLAQVNSMHSCPSQPVCNSTSTLFSASTYDACISKLTDYRPPSTTKYMVTAIYFNSMTCEGSPTVLNYAAVDTCIRNQKRPDQEAGYFTCNPDGTVTSHYCNLDCTVCSRNVTMPSGCVPQIVGMITSCKPNLLLRTLP